jgi:hypothetical protein
MGTKERMNDASGHSGQSSFTERYQDSIQVNDWRKRINKGKKIPKVAAIANPRSRFDVKNLGYGNADDLPTFIPWNRGYLTQYDSLGDVYLEMFMIGSTAESLVPIPANRNSIRNGKEQLKAVIRHVVSDGFDIVALTASTKRLLSATELREFFPGIVFTLGDNLTALALWKQVLRVMDASSLFFPRILVVGPSGFLGGAMIERLLSSGHDVFGLGSDEKRAETISRKYGIRVHTSIEEVECADMIVACNHGVPITGDFLERLYVSKKIPVVDVCEPPAFSRNSTRECRDIAVRVDADVYSDHFEFVLAEIAEQNMSLGRRMLYPCFAEAIHLAMEPALRSRDWLSVNLDRQNDLEETCFSIGRFRMPEKLLSFGEEVCCF